MKFLPSNHRNLSLVPLLLFLLVPPGRGADIQPTRNDGIKSVGEVLTYALPLTALGITAYFKDKEGAWQLTESAAISMTTMVALKYTIRATRPNGDPYSFPSGHATIVFCGAEFLRKRYGWQYGAPAYLLASFVGYSRIHAHEHYFRDVAAGATIAFVTTYLVTTPYRGWSIRPELGARYRGVKFSREY